MDLKHVQSLIDLLRANQIKKFSIKEADGDEISLEFHSFIPEGETCSTPSMAAPVAPQVAAVPSASVSRGTVVKAEMVGTVYLSMSPQKPKFVEVGSKVQKGQTLCLIEAMKTYFEVKATVDGVIDQVFVQDKEMVDFGKPLFVIV